MNYTPETEVSTVVNGHEPGESTRVAVTTIAREQAPGDDNVVVEREPVLEDPPAKPVPSESRAHTKIDKSSTPKRSSGGRPPNPETERQKAWVRNRLNKNLPVTGTMLDNHFKNEHRNGARIVAMVKRDMAREGDSSN
jgi:hypothetical protein